MEPISQVAYSVLKSTPKVFETFIKAREQIQIRRFSEFLSHVDTNYETMSVEDNEELNNFINSKEGERFLVNYADAILQTTSNRVMMALALLYCNKDDFNELNKVNFIQATKNLDDDLVDFYLTTHNNNISDITDIPYRRLEATSESYKDTSWNEEDIATYINELIRLRLLLPDPVTVPVFSDIDDLWTIFYGIGKNTQKYVNLLNKASNMLATGNLVK